MQLVRWSLPVVLGALWIGACGITLGVAPVDDDVDASTSSSSSGAATSSSSSGGGASGSSSGGSSSSSGGASSSSGDACVPGTCADVGGKCGAAVDVGCGQTLGCDCAAPQTCAAAGPAAGSCCTPHGCDPAAQCGTQDDGCGGQAACGGCPTGGSCNGNACACATDRKCTGSECYQMHDCLAGDQPPGCSCGVGSKCVELETAGNERFCCAPRSGAEACAGTNVGVCRIRSNGCGSYFDCNDCGAGRYCDYNNQTDTFSCKNRPPQ